MILAAGAALALGSSPPRHTLRLRAPEISPRRTDLYPQDPPPRDPVKRAVFERINQDRAEAGRHPVVWDEEAARAADDFCTHQVAEKTRGHFLTDGIPPYARMSFAGVFGMHSENSVSWVTNAETFSDPLVKLALEGHDEMLREKPPADGHRRAILDPDATHVGVGYSASHGRFQMTQEFLARGLRSLSLSPLSGSSGVYFDGRPLPEETLHFVTVGWEPSPRPMTRQEASGRTSYSYPNPRLSYVPEGLRTLRVSGTTSEDRLKIRTDHSFTFEFVPSHPGLYSLVFYLSARPSTPPRPGASTVLWFD
jgi:cysteine-rich secretory family protein